MTEASAQDEAELSPRERDLMYIALRSLATSLQVLANAQRATIAHLDASHEAYVQRRAHHARTMELLREALALGSERRCEAEERRERDPPDMGITPTSPRVSGRVPRKRRRSRSAAG